MAPDDDAPGGEIELISDKHGLAVIGDPAAVELVSNRASARMGERTSRWRKN